MALTPFEKNMDIIAGLSDSPNVDDGLTSSQLKARFDEGGKALKEYINETLLPAVAEKPGFTGLVKNTASGFAAAVPGEDYLDEVPDGAVTRAKLGSDVTAANLGGAVPSVTKTATLSASGWASKSQTVTVSGITASQHLVIAPAAASYVMYGECFVRCVTQTSGSLTFQCEDVPASDLTVNILIVG